MKEFLRVFSSHGVIRVETEGRDFDPNFHEAIAEEASELEKGKIIRAELAGYTLHGRLIRPAKVVISQGVNESN